MARLLVYGIGNDYFKLGRLLIAVLLFSTTTLCAQNKVDSLQGLIKESQGAVKYDALVALVREFGLHHNENQALAFAEQAKDLAYDLGDSARIVLSHRIIGQLLNRLDRAKEAVAILAAALPIAKRNNLRDDYKVTLSNLALAYTMQAEYDKALEINFQTLVLREEDKDVRQISISLNNIGLVYFKLRNFDKALDFYKRALALKKESDDKYDLDRLLINIGLCYIQLGDFSKANDFFNDAFKVCDGNCSQQIQVEGEFGMGIAYYSISNFEESIKHFNKSYFISEKIDNKRFQSENLLYLARIYVLRNDTTSAINSLKLCEDISGKFGYNQILLDAYNEFSVLFKKLNDFERASDYQAKYISLNDSIFNNEMIDKIAKVQTNYAERENIATIATKEEVIKQQRNINIAVGVITILAILLITVLYHSNKVKKRVNNALSEAKNIIEMKNRELDKKVADKTADLEKANESLVKVNEELDNFIYKTSHDIRGPLASLKGICNVALMDVKDEVAIGYLSKLDLTAEHLNTVLTRLLIINQINNSSLKPELINFSTLIDEVLALERKKGLPDRITIKKYVEPGIEYQSDKEFVRIILDNLIGNAIKFYNDSGQVEPFVEINVAKEGEELLIRVIDNGIGLKSRDPDDKIFQMFSRASERSSTGGIGLYITKLAAEKIHGEVGLRTTPEGYTEFYVKIPIEPIIQRYETEFI